MRTHVYSCIPNFSHNAQPYLPQLMQAGTGKQTQEIPEVYPAHACLCASLAAKGSQPREKLWPPSL